MNHPRFNAKKLEKTLCRAGNALRFGCTFNEGRDWRFRAVVRFGKIELFGLVLKKGERVSPLLRLPIKGREERAPKRRSTKAKLPRKLQSMPYVTEFIKRLTQKISNDCHLSHRLLIPECFDLFFLLIYTMQIYYLRQFVYRSNDDS